MKVKRYFAEDMRSALAMVREAQGPDVVILSNRSVEGGVELITTDEDASEEALREAARAHAGQAAGPAAAGKVSPAAGAGAETLWTREPMMERMQAELAALRRLVETQIAGLAWGERARREPLRADVQRRLVGIGITPAVADALVARLPEATDSAAAWRRALVLLAESLPVAGKSLLEGGVFALVGPTGVGKSTLLAKLAAHFALERGAEELALVSTDERRLGAHEQLRSFGRILGVPVWTAADGEALARALDAAGGRRLVLVDTPGGLSAQDVAELGETLAAGGPALKALLCVDALAQSRALQNALAALAPLAPAGCCITKLDEAGSLGPALSAVITAELPLHYLSTGRGIPEDLEPAVRHRLVARAVALHKGSVLDYDEALVQSAFEESPHANT